MEEFNRNVYDIIIAADEKHAMLGDKEEVEEEEEAEETKEDSKNPEGGEDDAAEKETPRPKKKSKPSKADKEYGVSRGMNRPFQLSPSMSRVSIFCLEEIFTRRQLLTMDFVGVDFKKVSAVINFDLPTTASSYTHRIGRTARAGQTGMALSFVVPKELYRKHMPTSTATSEKDEKVMAKIVRQQAKRGKEVKPYNFNMKQVDPFRYRMNDALRAVTKVSIREARTRELRQELLKSEKLKR